MIKELLKYELQFFKSFILLFKYIFERISFFFVARFTQNYWEESHNFLRKHNQMYKTCTKMPNLIYYGHKIIKPIPSRFCY